MPRKFSTRSRFARQAVEPVLEMLERRMQMDATIVPISPTPFAQNWSNTNLITTDNDWGSVPGITGYNPNLPNSADVDPQTITGDFVLSANVQVVANQIDPITAAGNGLAEFELTDPVVALKASSSSDAPFLLFNVKTTGVSSVQVSYNLRDIDASANNVVSQVALQYRVGTSGAFINVPAGYVPDATTGPNLATKVTAVSAALPAAAGNQPQVQIRIISSNANNPDEWIGVDDISIKQGNPGALAFQNQTPTVNEAAGTATINVIRTGGATGAVGVNFAATAGTASASDFTPISGTLNFAEGQTLASFNVAITNDSIAEPSETINLTLTNPTNGATLGAASIATLTIYDNDGTPPAVLLNEIDVNPPGADAPFEYVELVGPAGAPLNDLYFVSIDGDPGSEGQADLVVNLTGQSIGSNGLLIIKSTAGGFTAAAGTAVLNLPDFDVAALENNANSFAVIYSQTPLTQGSDLDPENDGVLNLAPGAVLADGIGWQDNGSAGTVYGALLVPVDGTPDAATRFPGNTTPRSSAAWYAADLLDTTASERLYDTDSGSSNIPAGAILTPGADNFTGSGGGAGTLGFSSFNYSVSEADLFATITVTRSAGLNGPATAHYAAAAGSAGASDFTAVSGTLSFSDGQTSTTFTVPISEDINVDPAETILLTLSSPTGGAVIGPRTSATLTIADNDILLNDIKANPPGPTDDPHEWIELIATPGVVLNDIYVVDLEGDVGANSGQATAAFNLGGVTVGSNGLVMLKAPDNNDITVAPGTTVVNTTIFDAPVSGGALQNGACTFLVIKSATAIATDQDLDSNDDGELDLPAGAVVLDGIGWKDSSGHGTIYAPVLTQSFGTPDAATRFVNDRNALSAPAWYNADLVDDLNDPTTIAYNPDKAGSNLPAGGTLTPGAPNFGQRDTSIPTIGAVEFDVNVPSERITIGFSESVFDSFSTKDVTLVDRSGGNVRIPSNNFDIAEGPGNSVLLTFKNYPGNALPDGRYRVMISHAGIRDTAGNMLGQDASLDFFSLAGDANHDAKVNALDFNALAANFGKANPTFAGGDFNYDGVVNLADFTLLSSRFNISFPAPVSTLSVANSPAASSLFSEKLVSESGEAVDPIAYL